MFNTFRLTLLGALAAAVYVFYFSNGNNFFRRSPVTETEVKGDGTSGNYYEGPAGAEGSYHLWAQDYDQGQRAYAAGAGRAGAGTGEERVGGEGAAMGYVNYDKNSNTVQASLQAAGRLRFGPIIIEGQRVLLQAASFCFATPSGETVCYKLIGSVQTNFGGSGWYSGAGTNYGNQVGGGWVPTTSPDWYKPTTDCPSCEVVTVQEEASGATELMVDGGLRALAVASVFVLLF